MQIKNSIFSVIILTLNEEANLPRLLLSLRRLHPHIFVLDSGSTDGTLEICRREHIEVRHHTFSNHPRQWHYALEAFQINTPWVICLDADQWLSDELILRLEQFNEAENRAYDGIYFNRKYFFKGRWIRYGGYYPKYLLKMFRFGKGYSDLQQNMDHRFEVPGKTLIWKDCPLYEENFKENDLRFWISKHNTYSDLLAEEDILNSGNLHRTKLKIFPLTPNERTECLKKIWQSLPLYWRTLFYFLFRMFFQMGFLDRKTGILFHFLQGFWFRIIVDMKIEERRKYHFEPKTSSFRFLFNFLLSFFFLYGFNLAFIGLSTQGGWYNEFLDKHLNYISAWRNLLIFSSASLLKLLNYEIQFVPNGLSLNGHAGFHMAYSCLGYGIASFILAFIFAYPSRIRSKIIFVMLVLPALQILNIIRLSLISIFYRKYCWGIDHHFLFNVLLYSFVALAIYTYIRASNSSS